MSERRALPPCGLYRTISAIGSVPAGRLVYFHNHGDPGPGIYLPSSWRGNRARFEARGHLLPHPEAVEALERLAREGFYRVHAPFFCCAKQCQHFEPDALVQLGYDGAAQPILFVPELVDSQLAVPAQGTRIDADRVGSLTFLKVRIVGEVHAPEDDGDLLLH